MASIRKRRTNDGRVRYQIRWLDDETGKHESATFPTSAAAKAFRLRVETAGNRWPDPEPEPDEHAPTLDEYAVTFLKNRTGITERTRHDYKRDLAAHISPAFGPVPLDMIDRAHIQSWVREMEGRLAPKTIQNLHGLLSNLLAEAVLARLIPGNPAQGTRLPQPHHAEDCFLTPQEFELIRSMVPKDCDKDLLTVLAGTGMRWGEVSALEPRHVDLLAPTPVVHVVQAWKRLPDGSYVLGPPKTRRSRRTVTLDSTVTDALVGHLTGDLVFPGRKGGRFRHANFYRVWQPAIEKARKAGLTKQPRLHDLRHSHVAWLIAAGVSLPKIQHRLGHESITTTIDRYGHLLPSDDADVRDAMTAALRG